MYKQVVSGKRGRKPSPPQLRVRQMSRSLGVPSSFRKEHERVMVEVDEESRSIRVKPGSDGNKISSNNSISCSYDMLLTIMSPHDWKGEIPIEYNEDDGWWYGSY